MKKILLGLLAILAVAGVSACGRTQEDTASSVKESVVSSTVEVSAEKESAASFDEQSSDEVVEESSEEENSEAESTLSSVEESSDEVTEESSEEESVEEESSSMVDDSESGWLDTEFPRPN